MSVVNHSLYEEGKIRCCACLKYIDPVLDLAEIAYDSLKRPYHKAIFCPVRTMYRRRLRIKSTYQKARLDKQRKATYY